MVILWEGKGIDEKQLISLNALKEKKLVISNVDDTFSNTFSFLEEVIYMIIGFLVKS